jgi:hypothetical protein
MYQSVGPQMHPVAHRAAWVKRFLLSLQVVMESLDKPRNIQSKGSIGDIVTDTGMYNCFVASASLGTGTRSKQQQ